MVSELGERVLGIALLLFPHAFSFTILCLLLAFNVIETPRQKLTAILGGDHYEVGEMLCVTSHALNGHRQFNVLARN
jgi:hypothetical protein